MFRHLADMLSGRGMRRLLWAVPLLLPITIAIRHPYAPFLLFQWVVTPAHMMPPNEAPRTFEREAEQRGQDERDPGTLEIWIGA